MSRRHKRSAEEVELNLASMLDMAFQILFFFVITFHPDAAESQITLKLPPAQPPKNIKTVATGEEKAGDTDKATDKVKLVDTLLVTVYSENGMIDAVQVGADRVPQPYVPKLDDRLRAVFADEVNPFEQVIVQCSPKLRYDQLMQVVEVCSRQKKPDGTLLKKLSFVELPDADTK